MYKLSTLLLSLLCVGCSLPKTVIVIDSKEVAPTVYLKVGDTLYLHPLKGNPNLELFGKSNLVKFEGMHFEGELNYAKLKAIKSGAGGIFVGIKWETDTSFEYLYRYYWIIVSK